MLAPPVAHSDESPAEANDEIAESPAFVEPDESLMSTDEIAESPPLIEQDESLPEANDEIDKWVRDARDSTVRTLELSKRLDDLLARPIRWFHRDAVDERTAVKSEADYKEQ